MPDLMTSTLGEININEEPTPSPPTPPTARPEPPGGQGGGNQLTRTTVNLTPRAVEALRRMTRDGRGPTKTELINRGIQLLEIVDQLLERNNGKLTVKHDDGTEQTIYVI